MGGTGGSEGLLGVGWEAVDGDEFLFGNRILRRWSDLYELPVIVFLGADLGLAMRVLFFVDLSLLLLGVLHGDVVIVHVLLVLHQVLLHVIHLSFFQT